MAIFSHAESNDEYIVMTENSRDGSVAGVAMIQRGRELSVVVDLLNVRFTRDELLEIEQQCKDIRIAKSMAKYYTRR